MAVLGDHASSVVWNGALAKEMSMQQPFPDAMNWVPKSRGLAATLARAYDYARAQAHRAVTLEHLLLALIADGDASLVLQACNIDLARLNADASNYLAGLADHAPPELAERGEPGADPNLIRILDYASAAAQQSRRPEVNGAIILAAIVGDGRSAAAAMLSAQGLTFEEAITALQRATNGSRGAAPLAPAPAPIPAPMSAPPPAAQSVPSAPAALHSRPHEITVTAGRPVNGSWGASTEEILATARRRVEAGRASTETAPAPHPPEQGQPLPQLQPHIEPWREPQPTTQAPSLPEPKVPDPQPVSPGSAQPMAGSVTGEPGAAPGSSSEAQEIDALAVARPPGRPAGPPPGHQNRANLPDLPIPPELSLPHSPRAPPMRPSGPPPLPEGAGPSARVPLPRPAPPQFGGRPPPQPVHPPWPEAGEARDPAHDPLRDLAFDGNIAGPPYLAPDEAAFSRVPSAAAWTPPPPTARHRPAVAPPAGRLVENLPRTMPVGIPKIVEARIAKAGVQALAESLQGAGTAYPHDVIITKTISVRLRAPDGVFWIDAASPETQWIENTHGLLTDDFASWRWTVIPQRRGRARLQLVVTARTVGADGLAAETALPDQIIEVRVRMNYGRAAAQWGGWIVAAGVGGVLARFGEGIWDAGFAAFYRLSGL
jgi:neural Wiskott-Aldrich syndrome protein